MPLSIYTLLRYSQAQSIVDPEISLADRGLDRFCSSKTDCHRRAKAERLSAIRAMQARQRKGILSEADKLKLAEEMAALSKTERMKTNDSDCVVM